MQSTERPQGSKEVQSTGPPANASIFAIRVSIVPCPEQNQHESSFSHQDFLQALLRGSSRQSSICVLQEEPKTQTETRFPHSNACMLSLCRHYESGMWTIDHCYTTHDYASQQCEYHV